MNEAQSHLVDEARAVWSTPHVYGHSMQLDGPTTRLLEALSQAGYRALVVGGSVRDSLLGHAPKDIDVEVFGASTGQVKAAVEHLGKVSEVGRSFGILKVAIEEVDFDLSIPRTDLKTGDGHRGFEVVLDPTMAVDRAFARRDFTVNAMGFDAMHSVVVDPHGGMKDLQARMLRHVSNAFDEDPLRVLRAVQLAGRFDLDLHPDTARRCAALTKSYIELPTERVWLEWEKIASKAVKPSKSLEVLYQTGWERHFPELAAVRDVPQSPQWHPEGAVHIHQGMAADIAAQIAEENQLEPEERIVIVLSALLHDLGKATHTQIAADGTITSRGHAEAGATLAQQFLRGVRAPQYVEAKVVPIVREHMCAASTNGHPSVAAVRRLQRRLLGAAGTGPSLQQWAWVCDADTRARASSSRPSPAVRWLEVATRDNVLHSPKPDLLGGRDLITRGMQPGPAFRIVLRAAREAQDECEYTDTDGAQRWLDNWISKHGSIS